MDTNHSNRLKIILISTMMMVTTISVFVCSAPNASAWSMGVTYSPGEAYIGDAVSFRCTLSNSGSYAVDLSDATLEIDWGSIETERELDGSWSISAGGTTVLTASFVVPDVIAGTYSMNVVLKGKASSDLLSQTHTYSCELDVTELPPVSVLIQADMTSGTAPLTVDFTSTVTGGDGEYSYSWTFGDGDTSTASNPEHTYDEAGTYTVTLVVTDDHDQSDSDSTTVIVDEATVLDEEFWDGNATTILLIGIISIAVIGIVAFVVYRRSKKK